MKSLNIRRVILDNTTPPKRRYFYAVIDGRMWTGKSNKVFYMTKAGLLSALRQSELYWGVVKPLADNYMSFRPGKYRTTRAKKCLYTRWWHKFLGPEGRVQIKSVETVEYSI